MKALYSIYISELRVNDFFF